MQTMHLLINSNTVFIMSFQTGKVLHVIVYSTSDLVSDLS